jgi:hypothetical protein
MGVISTQQLKITEDLTGKVGMLISALERRINCISQPLQICLMRV